jgi:hypothetical protein
MFICRERVNLDEKSINKLSDYTCLSAVSRANRALLENDTFRKKQSAEEEIGESREDTLRSSSSG